MLAAALLIVLWPATARAYLDPGTGSALAYVIGALVVSAYFFVRKLYYQVFEFLFRRRFGDRKCDLALHSEDPRYETTFMPVIRALAERDVEVTYFTMYERDDSCDPLPPQVTHRSLPPGLVGYSFLNHLEARMLVTTTPQLDVMMFRRSKRVKHYCHIPHALGESRFVRPYAYDFFDSVLCCGPLLEQNIRRIEGIRGLPEKQLFRTGIPQYDIFLARATRHEPSGERKTVLVAPSWGPMSLFEVFGTDFVRAIRERYEVVVRPHPQMRLSQPELYEQVLALEGVSIDTGPSPVDAISRADTVVSDISGIAYEFAFIHEKPVIVVDHKRGVEGLEGHFLRDVETLQARCGEFIIGLPPSEMESLVDKIDEVLAQDLPARIAKARGEIVHHFGKAGPVAAEQIEQVLACL
jgi:hypothetical protein